jgi:SNF2 family DNA or RNA helicase
MLKVSREPRFSLKYEGFAYQVEAVAAVRDLEFAAIFHEQGLGKTKIGIDLGLLWLSKDVVDSVLVVTKKGLVQNWRDEIRRHTFLEPRILDQDRRGNFYGFNSPVRLYLTHYEVAISEAKRLALFLKTRRVAVMLDESHKIKNPDSRITKAFFGLSHGFRRRVIMTGTPVANRPYDLWAQIYFLDHGASLGNDFKEFRASLDLTNDLWRDKSKAEAFEDQLALVFGRIQHFTVRKTKQTAGIVLPDKHLKNISVDLEGRQMELYARYRQELAAIIVKAGKRILDDAEEVLKRLLRLVQMASNPHLVDQAYHATPGKLPILVRLIEEVVDAGEKAIVWTAFTENADWLARELQSFGATALHGKRSIVDRNRSIQKFKTDQACRVLVATPGAAKEGLTLTVANHAIFFDRTFSLDDYLQAQDRIHRISQTRTCFVSNLIGRDTVDEWVDVLLAAKALAAQLAQGDIAKHQYKEDASYSFGEMIQAVLNIETKKAEEEHNDTEHAGGKR